MPIFGIQSQINSADRLLSRTILNLQNRMEPIEEVRNYIAENELLISLQYTITFEGLNREVTIPVITNFLQKYTSNQNIDSNSVFIFNVTKNEDTNMYSLMCLISNNINIEHLKSKIIINLAKPDSVNFEYINTFKSSDNYDVWVYTTNADSGNKTYYNVPNEDYANLIMKYDPFVYKNDNNFTIGVLNEETINELRYKKNDPLFLLSKNYYHLNIFNNVRNITTRSSKRNVLMIFFDQYNSWANLPESFTSQLKGYQAFKSKGIDFTKCYNNRQMCSPARGSVMVGKMDTGINDNIDQSYQYQGRPNLDDFPNTAGHLFKNAGYDITCYYGKNHFDSRMATDAFIAPYQNNATAGGMRKIGFDRYNELGDDFYNEHHAFLSDQLSFDRISMLGTVDDMDYDIEIDGVKYSGMKPFLKARSIDNKSFHAQFHFTNPHDIMHYWSNPQQIPSHDVMAVGYPFYYEQKEEFGIDPYYYNELFQNSMIKNVNYVKNWFEDNYEDYKTNATSLLYYESFINDYAINPDKSNSLYSIMVGYYYGLVSTKTSPSQEQICFWKNFQNAYLNTIQHVDNYLYEIHEFMDKNGMFENTAVLISADHGEMSASHGMQQKGLWYKNSCNVPLLIISPDLDSTLIGTTNNTIVNSVDINPTLAALGMFKNPNLEDFTGQALLVQNNNGKLVVADNLIKENLGLLNNWMVWSTWILLWQNVNNNIIEKDDICDYATNPLEYNYLCYYYRKKIANKEYNYIISYDILTMIKYQYLEIKNVSFMSITDLYIKFCKIDLDYINDIVIEGLNQIDIDIGNGETLVYKLYESGLVKIYSLEGYTDLQIEQAQIIFSLTILLLVFICLITIDITDVKELFDYIKNVRSHIFLSQTPFVADKESLNNSDDYLEYLFDLENDPSESVNLLDPKRTEIQIQEVSSVRDTLRDGMINNIENINNMSKFEMTIISPVFYNLFERFDNLFKSQNIYLLNVYDENYNYTDIEKNFMLPPSLISKAIMSLNGENNMDAPSFTLEALKIIANIRNN
jgi:arylsulfatase A-like enzyme